MLNFDFLENGLGKVAPAHFVHDFFYKSFSCYILSTAQISLPGCLYFLRYQEIGVLQLFVKPGCDVMDFEINGIFLIS